MDDLAGAAAKLAAMAKNPLTFKPDFQALKPPASNDLPRTIAVDGSAAILVDNGSVWIAAIHAEAVTWPGHQAPLGTPRILAATPREARQLLAAEYAEAGFDAPRASSAESWAGHMQALAEWKAARDAISQRPDLLLIDGALRGIPPIPQAMADFLVTPARDSKVPILGVAKRSGIGDALVPALMEEGPAHPWLVEVPGEVGVWVARLHARAAHAFRVDADSRADIEALIPLCRDAGTVGYPYPLVVAHNRVAMTGGRVAELKARLERELRLHGPTAARLAADFHAVLDRNVPS